MSTKVQIYLKTADDAAMTAASGAHFIGIACNPPSSSEASASYAHAREVLAAVPEGTVRVALTSNPDLAVILQMVRAVQPDVVQLAGLPQRMPPADVARLRAAIHPVKVIRGIPVGSRQSIELALSYQAACDYLLLDTLDPGTGEVGATGRTHDWNISAELVRRVHIPVFLAGGLSPDNVAQAICAVRPWGVDSYSLTNLPGPEYRKDPAKVRAFIANAKAAA